MSETFADSARHLAGLSGALLGWRPAEFWAATPCELAAIMAALSPVDASGGTPADSEDLARLREQFPDG